MFLRIYCQKIMAALSMCTGADFEGRVREDGCTLILPFLMQCVW